jgi:hypothetical protein
LLTYSYTNASFFRKNHENLVETQSFYYLKKVISCNADARAVASTIFLEMRNFNNKKPINLLWGLQSLHAKIK